MTRINPCFRCPLRHGCEQRAEFQRRVVGLGARSVTFACAKLAAELRPGRRVAIKHPAAVPCRGDDDGYTIEHIKVAATITAVDSGMRFSSVVDPTPEVFDGDDKYRFRRKQAHYRILRFLDEPDLKLCDAGNVQHDGKCESLSGCHCASAVAEFGEVLQ